MGTSRRVFLAGGLLGAAQQVWGQATRPARTAATRPSPTSQPVALRVLAGRRNLLIGAACFPEGLRDERYARILGREFNFITPENAMKWEPIHPQLEEWRFEPADALVQFAAKNRMKVKGHALLWHLMVPKYLSEMSPEGLRDTVEEHIRTLVTRFRGKVYAWDVVNEGVGDDGRLRDSLFAQKLSDDYIAEAFRIAHLADAQAMLIYNDYGAEGMGVKSDGVFRLVRELVDKKVPIHGVGLQMHIKAEGHPPIRDIVANVRRLTGLGLKVNISEMDVRIRDVPGDLPARLERQRQVYHDIIAACVDIKGFMGVTFWGFSDAASWVDSFFGPDDPLLFDDEYKVKPAYYGVNDAMKK